MNNFHVYQIFYSESTLNELDPGFLPLDNSDNPRPDWYEFWVMRSFLTQTTLDENGWYGFLSPKFFSKVGLCSEQVYRFLDSCEGSADVALVPYAWDQTAYFRNPFEQGEYWHPGITEVSEAALGGMGYSCDIRSTVCHSGNFTFSNFVIAKPVYWRRWLEFANAFFDFVENGLDEAAGRLRGLTTYGSFANLAPIKTFIQERMLLLLIEDNKFRTCTYDLIPSLPIFARVFVDDEENRELLVKCDALKRKYLETKDEGYLEEYYFTRGMVRLSEAMNAGFAS